MLFLINEQKKNTTKGGKWLCRVFLVHDSCKWWFADITKRMSEMTKKQKQQLLTEIRKQRGLINTDLIQWLHFISSICLVDIWLDYLDFWIVKDKQGDNHIRATRWVQEIIIIDNNVMQYKMDTPEDYVELFEKLLLKLKKKNG